MKECHEFLRYILPTLGYRWPGFRKVRRQVCRRIHSRMQDLRIKNYTDYILYIEENSNERDRLDEMLDITITRFWRDRGVYEILEKIIFPDLTEKAERDNRLLLHCWSAGCCNGEEPYSLSLLWDIRLSVGNIQLEITATDRNQTVLERAQKGIFPIGAMRDIPDDIRMIGFENSANDYIMKEQYKRRIQFLKQDIRNEMPDNIFDVILCRNLVFTYFDISIQKRLLTELAARLRPEGYLIIGSNEQLPQAEIQFKKIKKREPVYTVN
jgi:chemotaxis protein methyltransferase CheR